jgi:Leucine-rich repeat (LRR) protein
VSGVSFAIQDFVKDYDLQLEEGYSPVVTTDTDKMEIVLGKLKGVIRGSSWNEIKVLKGRLEEFNLTFADSLLNQKIRSIITLAGRCLFLSNSMLENKKTSLRTVDEKLNLWLGNSRNEDRLKAYNEILRFLDDPFSEKLDLSDCKLDDLPDVFGDEEVMGRLQDLNLSRNYLKTLPDSINALRNLRALNLSNNKFSYLSNISENFPLLEELDISLNHFRNLPGFVCHCQTLLKLNLNNNSLGGLPTTFRNLTSLKKICLGDNRLSFFPKELTFLNSLEDLYLNGNKISVFPNFLFGELPSLKRLNLSENQLISLPDSIGFFKELKVLSVGGNLLTSLPPSLKNLVNLEKLILFDNRFESFPEIFDSFEKMKELSLRKNETLTGIPNTIFNLPESCCVNIEECGFSTGLMQNLYRDSMSLDYFGPRFKFSVFRNISKAENRKETQQLIRELYSLVGREPKKLKNLPLKNTEFRMWLSRLTIMADYNAQGARQQALVGKILNYLERADRDSQFLMTLRAVISGAIETCGDRMALSVVHLGIAYEISTINPNTVEMGQLAEFLKRGVWAMKLLEMIAMEKMRTLKCVDEIEVYLAYPTMLKERLQLPINIEDMLFLNSSGITSSDLDVAQDFVNMHLNDQQAVAEFLITQEIWLKALSHRCPKEVSLLKQVKRESLRDISNKATNSEYIEIERVFNQRLVDLTKFSLL